MVKAIDNFFIGQIGFGGYQEFGKLSNTLLVLFTVNE